MNYNYTSFPLIGPLQGLWMCSYTVKIVYERQCVAAVAQLLG